MAEDAWNSRDPNRVSLAYTRDSKWRNRSEIFQGRDQIVEFLSRKWKKELEYRTDYTGNILSSHFHHLASGFTLLHDLNRM